jgi:hypothetical protein
MTKKPQKIPEWYTKSPKEFRSDLREYIFPKTPRMVEDKVFAQGHFILKEG